MSQDNDLIKQRKTQAWLRLLARFKDKLYGNDPGIIF